MTNTPNNPKMIEYHTSRNAQTTIKAKIADTHAIVAIVGLRFPVPFAQATMRRVLPT
jgi:hypothetical protein